MRTLLLVLNILCSGILNATPARPFPDSTEVVIGIKDSDSEEKWLDADAGSNALSLNRHIDKSETHWRLNALGNGIYTIESLSEHIGPRWLNALDNGSLNRVFSDTGLTTRWRIKSEAGAFTLENIAVTSSLRWLNAKAAEGRLQPGISQDKSLWQIEKPQGAVYVPPFRHGDTLLLGSIDASRTVRWLDGNTYTGSVSLIAGSGNPALTGLLWRLHENGDGTLSIECLGNHPGPRWLSIINGVPALSPSPDRDYLSRWKIIRDGKGNYRIRSISATDDKVWLSGQSKKASAQLLDSLGPQDGLWHISRKSQSTPAQDGRWSSVVEFPVSGIHTTLLPNGKVLTWSRFVDALDYGSTVEGVPVGGQDVFLFDPRTNSSQAVPNAFTDPFCSGHALLADGRLLVNGGHKSSFVGLPTTQIFDYRTNTWSRESTWDMQFGRWYPTTITMTNGEVLTASGDITNQNDVHRIPQIWNDEQKRWRDLPALSSACLNTKGPCLPLYPWIFPVGPNKAFVSGPGQITGYIHSDGEGQWEVVASTQHGYRGDYEATSVMYAPGKILIAGGYPPTPSVETIDLNARNVEWTETAPLLHARHKLTSTLLADGTVLINGGRSGPGGGDAESVFASEIWDPETRSSRAVDHMQVPRLYHSTSVLLPDARVLSMGGGLGAGYVTHKNFEIYSPPYLFKGDRPEVGYAPAEAPFASEIFVRSRQASSIQKVSLVRLSSDTHSINGGQSFRFLPFTYAKYGLSIRLPDREIPPGHYLLFLLNTQGVPSLGQIIRLY